MMLTLTCPHATRNPSRRQALTLLLLPVFHCEAQSMSLLGPKTCVFSAVKARLTRNGEPLKDVTVIRRWTWHDAREDRTRTNARGEFSFPAVFESSVSRLLPVELAVAQSLYVKGSGEEEMFWVNTKRRPEENAEYKGHPISLACELSREMKITREFGSIMSTMCTLEP
jgi:hypothetical protein